MIELTLKSMEKGNLWENMIYPSHMQHDSSHRANAFVVKSEMNAIKVF